MHIPSNACVHGGTCQYSHVKALPAKPKNSKADSRAKPKPATPKVAAAVAITAALSSMVTPSQAIGSLEWAADTGAGRHLGVVRSSAGTGVSQFPLFRVCQ